MNTTPFYYYTILDIPTDATLPVIKTAYKKKALKFHPDKCKDPKAAETFKEINQAFHVLSDIDKRRCYDSFGGVERPEIPVTITKPFEDFCEGIALGTFSIFANLSFITIFGTPALGISGWMLATQFITAWHMIPESIEEAKDYRNWSKALGTLFAPVFLVTSTSCVAGYLLYNGSKMALEYSMTKMEEIGEQIKKGVQSFQLPGRRENLSLTLDDWVVLDEKKSNNKKRSSSIPPISSTSNSYSNQNLKNDSELIFTKDSKTEEEIPLLKIEKENSKQEISREHSPKFQNESCKNDSTEREEIIFGWESCISGNEQDELKTATKKELNIRDSKDDANVFEMLPKNNSDTINYDKNKTISEDNFYMLYNYRKTKLEEGDSDWVLLDDILDDVL